MVAVNNTDPNFAWLFVVQIGAGVAILASILFLPTPWNWAHWLGLAIAAPALVLLCVARNQLGRSFSVTAQARQLVTGGRSEEHTSELQSRFDLVCRLLLEKKK